MSKQVEIGRSARAKMVNGIDILNNAVKVTLGPKGRNVVLERTYGSPLITNDGVSIAKEIELSDPFERMGAKLVYEVANKTNDVAGDGTTTATLLAHSIIHNGLDAIDKGANPVIMREGMEKASRFIADKLLEKARKIESDKEIASIASISAGSNEVGVLISQAMERYGRNAVISVDESQGFETVLEFVDGMKYDKGYISPYMVSDREKMIAELEDAYILVSDYKITSIQEILPLLEMIIQKGKPLLIIAEDIDDEVVTTLVVNKMRGNLNVVVTKAPYFGEYQKGVLEDIALKTNAKMFAKDLKYDLKEIMLDDLGHASKIIVKKEETTIFSNDGEIELIENRVIELNKQINDSLSNYDKNRLTERIARLTNGIALIKVGAATESELKEKKLRIEDALNSTRAAVSEGILAGGGSAYISIYKKYKDVLKGTSNDEQKGINAVFEALLMPLHQIAENAGYDGKDIVNKQLLTEDGIGFDALSGEWKDMFINGIIDPCKVTRQALINATSIAALFITSEAAVVSDDKDMKNNQMNENNIF